jgi:hypothetical protein
MGFVISVVSVLHFPQVSFSKHQMSFLKFLLLPCFMQEISIKHLPTRVFFLCSWRFLNMKTTGSSKAL